MTVAQAFAGGLALDAASRALGREHGRAGLAWRCPDGGDLLAYALGHADGLAERRGRGGEAQADANGGRADA